MVWLSYILYHFYIIAFKGHCFFITVSLFHFSAYQIPGRVRVPGNLAKNGPEGLVEYNERKEENNFIRPS